MAELRLSGPTSILVIEGLTLPQATDEHLAHIGAAAPDGSTLIVASGMRDAVGRAGDAEVVLGFVNQALFEAAPRLRWVHAIASGVDELLFPAFVASDVILTGEKGLVGGHLADTGFGLLLALTRQIAAAILAGPRAWEQRLGMRRAAIELEGMTMGVVGFGGTGRAMARRAKAFGMNVIAVDEVPGEPSDGVAEVWHTDRLDELVASSDVVAVCCPLTDTTRGLFDAARLARMPRGAYLVNVTRGEIVVLDDLVDCLRSGHLAGAALDVVEGEPLAADHPIFGLENVAMTPHTAGASQLRADRNVERFCDNLRRAQKGEPLVGVVDKVAGY